MTALVTFQEAKNHLRLKDELDDTKARKLRSIIGSVTSAVEARVGWVAQREMTFTVDGGARAAVLPGSHVLSVKSAGYIRTGESIDVTGMRVEDGILTRSNGGHLPPGPLTITVMVGRATVPDAIREGTLEIIREAWGASQSNSPNEAARVPFLISYRADAFFEGHHEYAGFA